MSASPTAGAHLLEGRSNIERVDNRRLVLDKTDDDVGGEGEGAGVLSKRLGPQFERGLDRLGEIQRGYMWPLAQDLAALHLQLTRGDARGTWTLVAFYIGEKEKLVSRSRWVYILSGPWAKRTKRTSSLAITMNWLLCLSLFRLFCSLSLYTGLILCCACFFIEFF